MSYLVTIKRPGGESITPEELRAAVRGDSDFSSVPDEEVELAPDVLNLVWRDPAGRREFGFVLSGGEIQITTPSDRALARMQELAGQLSAHVIGEEGEDLTAVGLADVEVGAGRILGCLAVLAPVLGVLLWFILT